MGEGGALEVGDAAHDQTAGDALGCLGGCECSEGDPRMTPVNLA